ncbi:DDE-type integrase/transposase/recombinase [Streptomyces varsoviensis]|uniref:DDE-type integrase/transposase/recombinase n=1 Tax=Streptomyces varsoviensis TaxID=67373 RepID=UPI0033EE511A
MPAADAAGWPGSCARPDRPAPKTPPPHHRAPDSHAATRPDLALRDFKPDPTAADTRWCGDITYIATEEGRLCLATVIGIASRRVVGWVAADDLRTELVADALRAACRTPARPVR